MNTKSNDDKILQLKEQIVKKKEQLGKSQKFVPVTNCILELDGVRYNLNVLNSREQIIPILVKLNAYKVSAIQLEVLESYFISGYNVLDWIKDLQSRMDYVSRKEQEANLKQMESKLDLLLSNEKKVELEISAIEDSLK